MSTLFIKKTIASLFFGATALGMMSAYASNAQPHYNMISFEVNVQKQIANNEAIATLKKTATAKDAKTLANQINPTIHQAQKIAKKYPSVAVSTGMQHSYPTYDNKGKLTGFTGSANLTLKSQDMEALGNLIGELQSLLTIGQLDFSVSDALKEQTHAQLMDEATQKFKSQAQRLVQAWGAKSYQIIKLDMNHASGHHYAPTPLFSMAMAEAKSNAPEIQAGESDIRYTINGTIELIF